MDMLKELLMKCRCGVYLFINEHRDGYKTAKEAIEIYDSLDLTDDLDYEVRSKMIETNTIVDLHFYPDNPVGGYKILHYDVDIALKIALEYFKN